MSAPKPLACAAAFVGLIALAACGTSGDGTIAGVYYGLGNVRTHVGGVASSGTLRIKGLTGTFTAIAGNDGRFSLTVPAGTYHVTGREPGQSGGISSCQVSNVHVAAEKTTHVAVTCGFR